MDMNYIPLDQFSFNGSFFMALGVTIIMILAISFLVYKTSKNKDKGKPVCIYRTKAE
jgi:hypothetical protein